MRACTHSPAVKALCASALTVTTRTTRVIRGSRAGTLATDRRRGGEQTSRGSGLEPIVFHNPRSQAALGLVACENRWEIRNVHYVLNQITGALDDFKIVIRGAP